MLSNFCLVVFTMTIFSLHDSIDIIIVIFSRKIAMKLYFLYNKVCDNQLFNFFNQISISINL